MNNLKSLLLASLVFLVTSSASAVTIIKFDLGNTGPDLSYSGNVLSTVNDGDASTTGDQNTAIDYVGFLDGSFADILSGASLTLANVTSVGMANVSGTLVTQATSGGTFDVYSASNVLLLSGVLSDGAIVGSNSSSTGSFFNTTVANFTSGSLLSVVSSSPAAFSISFTNITSRAGNFLDVTANGLQAFTADATGQIEGAAVPEPATVALLLSGVLGGIAKRRRSA